jgi:hypothetical protein
MLRQISLFLAALVLGWIYLIAFAFAVGLSAAQPTPHWWPRHPNPAHAALMWLTLAHLFAMVLISVPFAWVIGRLYGRLGIPLALVLTVSICAFVEMPALSEHFGSGDLLLRSIWLFGAAVLVIALPLEVWAFQKWPSNQRLERP